MRSFSSIFLQSAPFGHQKVVISGVVARTRAHSVHMWTENRTQVHFEGYCLDQEVSSLCTYDGKLGDFFFNLDYLETPVVHKFSAKLCIQFYLWSFSWAQFIFVKSKFQARSEDEIYFNDIKLHFLRDITSDKQSILQMKVSNGSSSTSHIIVSILGFAQGGQFLRWQHTLDVSNKKLSLVVALSCLMESISVKLMGCGGCNNATVSYQWISMGFGHQSTPDNTQNCASKGVGFSESCEFVKHTSFGLYFFQQHHGAGCYFTDKSCQHTQYSWHQVKAFCERKIMYLPEFFGRKEEEELLEVLKMSYGLYLIEAIYIGLEREASNKVGMSFETNCPTCTKFNAWTTCNSFLFFVGT